MQRRKVLSRFITADGYGQRAADTQTTLYSVAVGRIYAVSIERHALLRSASRKVDTAS